LSTEEGKGRERTRGAERYTQRREKARDVNYEDGPLDGGEGGAPKVQPTKKGTGSERFSSSIRGKGGEDGGEERRTIRPLARGLVQPAVHRLN